jgi:hypothetical protein
MHEDRKGYKMECSCGSKRLCRAEGKTCDSFSIQYRTCSGLNKEKNCCYPPRDVNIAKDSDGMDITYCLDCGKIQGKWPISDEEMSKAVEG